MSSQAKELLDMGHELSTELWGQEFTVDGIGGALIGNLSIDDLTNDLTLEGNAPKGTARLDVSQDDITNGWIPRVGQKIRSDSRYWTVTNVVPDNGFFEIALLAQ